MKIAYNATGAKRKGLVSAIAALLAVESAYLGAPSYSYTIGGYTVDREGNLLTPEEASDEDIFRLVDGLYAEYELKCAQEDWDKVHEDEDNEAGHAEDGSNEVKVEDSAEEADTDAPEQPEPEAPEAPENGPETGDSPESEAQPEEAEEAPENADNAPNTGEETGGTEATESPTETTDTEEADPAEKTEPSDDEDSDETKLTLSLPRKNFSPGAIERLKALIASKQSLLKKVFDAEELPVVLTDDQIQFPWFTLQNVDGEIDAYAKFIYAIAKRALTSSRISATEKPTDNEKFTMRLFLNSLGFKGEEFKFARRFLIRNLEGNGAWRYGNAPDAASFDLEMPTVFKPTVNPPAQDEPTEAEAEGTSDDEPEEEVGNEEEESTDEE